MSRFRSYRKRRSYILAVVLILLAILFSFSGLRNPLGVRSVLQAAIYPFQFAAATGWRTLINIPISVAGLRDLSRQNSEAQNELAALKAKLLLFDELKNENERLRSRLGFEQNNPYGYNLLPAQVIGRAP
ncbi:MAG: hypothetical protein KJ732_05835, partial [Candidatus Margulisbacteria bacterium]|nr:hypothetical protein [Candidatus Margulisiibacteriota bacterium]